MSCGAEGFAARRQYIIVWRGNVRRDMPGPDAKSPQERMQNSAVCKHVNKRLIARDDDAEYWECLDCGEIFEPGEGGGVVNIDGSLSDA
jgi:hypothetical protein